MKAFNRTNRLGLRYTLIELVNNKTQIQLQVNPEMQKSIIVDHPIVLLERSWENWKNGDLLQAAFPFLTATEREFILTGISDAEWDELFKD